MLRSFEVQVVSTALSCMAWITLRLPSHGSQAGYSGLKASNVEYIVPCSRGNVDIWGLQGLYRDNGKENGIY